MQTKKNKKKKARENSAAAQVDTQTQNTEHQKVFFHFFLSLFSIFFFFLSLLISAPLGRLRQLPVGRRAHLLPQVDQDLLEREGAAPVGEDVEVTRVDLLRKNFFFFFF